MLLFVFHLLQLAWEHPPGENANGPVGVAVDIRLRNFFPKLCATAKEMEKTTMKMMP